MSEEQLDYSDSLKKELDKIKLRVDIDKRNEKLGLKIREAEVGKTPYILTVGKSEMENKTVNVRQYGGKQIGEIKFKDFVSMMKKDIRKGDSL